MSKNNLYLASGIISQPSYVASVTGRAQCTEVTPSCSSCNQRTRVLIMWLGINVACTFSSLSYAFKKRALHALFHHLKLLLHSSSSSSSSLVSSFAKIKTFAHQSSKVWFFSIDCSLFLICALITVCDCLYFYVSSLPHHLLRSSVFWVFSTRVRFIGFL